MNKRIVGAVLFAVTVNLAAGLLFSGCGGAKLETGGAYAPVGTNGVAVVAPDIEFYAVDLAYKTAWLTADAAFNFERDNRAALWQLSPQIKRTLDSIRPKAKAADHDYLVGRAAYMANPTPAGLSTLQEILARMKQIVATVQAVLPQAPTGPAKSQIGVAASEATREELDSASPDITHYSIH